MPSYQAGPSVLRLPGLAKAIQPGERFDYTFSPEQERSLLAAGAITVASAVSVDRPSRRPVTETKE